MSEEQDPPLNLDPSVIGYWARTYDFKLVDFLHVEYDGEPDQLARQKLKVQSALADQDAQRAFKEGWEQADRELRNERFNDVLGSLHEAHNATKDSPP